MYLKRAALNRLNARLMNKKEQLQAPFRANSIDIADLEPSTLSYIDKYHINRWLQGIESGRACMLAIIDNRQQLAADSNDNVMDHATSLDEISSNLQLSLLTASVSLPDDFLCNNNYIYQQIFSKPPATVIREALELLKEKAHEQSIENLDCEQINMAIKQIRIINLTKATSVPSMDNSQDYENQKNSANSSRFHNKDVSHTAKVSANLRHVKDEELRLQIIIELIHLHIASTNPDDDGDFNSDPSSPTLPGKILVDDIHLHLQTPLDHQEEKALTMSPEMLEKSNTLLKPYISQLAVLRSNLQSRVKELEENAAFFSLGLDRGCRSSDAQIKKAYHALAVRLHPDKGGDTAKFQALQVAYQEVLKKKKERDAMQSAMEENMKDGCDVVNAQHIVALVAAGIAIIQEAATQTTSLAQLNIRMMKDIENAASSSTCTSEVLRRIKALIKNENDGDIDSGNDSDSDSSLSRWMKQMDAMEPVLSVGKSVPPYADSKVKETIKKYFLPDLSPKLAISPLEKICEHLQLMAAKAMELPSCGSKYGIATARCAPFIEGIEKCMATGLASLKTTSSLSLADTQIASSVMRLQFAPMSLPRGTGKKRGNGKFVYDDSDGDSEFSDVFSDESHDCEADDADEEFRKILIEMVITAFRSASVSINVAAERAISAVVIATDLHLSLVNIISTADRDRKEAAKRKAEQEEADSQFSADDNKMMNEMKFKAMAEEKAKHDEAKAKAKVADEAKRQREAEEDAQDVTGMKALGRLKNQIQSLQVQLHIQHVTTLHTLNSEARGLQAQIQSKVQNLPESGCGSTRCRPVGSENNSDDSNYGDVVLLIADLIDSSYAELRLAQSAACSEGVVEGTTRNIRSYLGWMIMMGGTAETVSGSGVAYESSTCELNGCPSQDIDVQPEMKGEIPFPPHQVHFDLPLRPPTPPLPEAEGFSSTAAAPQLPSLPLPLALLPDHRSRALLVAFMMHEDATLGLVNVELRERLVGFVCTSCADNSDFTARLLNNVNLFCDEVVTSAKNTCLK